MKKDELNDLGLGYVEAAHGVQSARAAEINGSFGPNELAKFETKHMRTGIDMSKSDMMGLVCLLMDKGIFTEEEYVEYMRLAANQELHREQIRHGITFR